MPSRNHADPWVLVLRDRVRDRAGRNFVVREQSGRAKLEVRFDDGSRKAGGLPITWSADCAREIEDACASIAEQVRAGRSLKDAIKLVFGSSASQKRIASAPQNSQGGSSAALLDAWEKFGHYKVQETGQIAQRTWDEEYFYSAKRLRLVADSISCKELLSRASEAWQPGQRRRQITLQHISSMLRWAVEEGLLPDVWQPPRDISRFVGKRIAPPAQRTPLLDAEILKLLQSLPADAAGKRWTFAFQLLAAYGLRPIELGHLRISPTGEVWCNYRKRSGGGTTSARQLRALHPDWEEQWRLRERITAGESLPPDGGGYGNAARRYLDRQAVWGQMKERGCTSYSYRHGFALRAHQQYGLSVRIAAALMGHSVETHVRHYGSWADGSTIDDAIAAGVRYRALTSRAD